MSRAATWVTAGLLPATAALAQTAGVDLTGVQQHAASVFDAAAITAPTSPLRVACDHLLLMAQAGSVAVIVAAMIGKMRKDKVQMEGIATVMLQVAFIALVPLLRTQTLEAADAVADALEYKSAAAAAASGSGSGAAWTLLQQWAPPGSPLLDALQTQANETPASGHEEEWTLSAWNWAKGVGATTAGALDAEWQAISGATRAGLVFVGCSVIACLLSFTIFAMYAIELLRQVLIYGGCAVLPLFIAGLAIDSFRGPCIRYVLLLASIAAWPIAWALANLVSEALTTGLAGWMREVVAAALSTPVGATPPPLVTAAPFVAWAMLAILGGATVLVATWLLVTAMGVPLGLARLVRSGAGKVLAHTTAVGTGSHPRITMAPSKPIVVTTAKASTPTAKAVAAGLVRPAPAQTALPVVPFAATRPAVAHWLSRNSANARRSF